MTTFEKNALNLKFIYYACDAEDLFSIGGSNTFEGLLELVDNYMGANDKHNNVGKRIKYEPHYSKYASDFEGTIFYETPEKQKVKVFSVDFNYKQEIT